MPEKKVISRLVREFKVLPLFIFFLFSCSQYDHPDIDADVVLIQEGIQTSSIIGYCSSVASQVFNDTILPHNLIYQDITRDENQSHGLMTLVINDTCPLPFNHLKGNITIAGMWDRNQGGIITILFTDSKIHFSSFDLYGLYTVPVIVKEDASILAVFAEQDIVVAEGSDTILQLNFTNAQFQLEMDRLGSELPGDPYAAVRQNAWFNRVDQNSTSDLYDDIYWIYGGGQIVEATDNSGGILYHALLGTELQYATCSLNPISGVAFLQNIKAGEGIELGTLYLEFRYACNGQAFVQLGTGKYFGLGGQYITVFDNP